MKPTILAALLAVSTVSAGAKPLTTTQATRAIIGEAGSEPFWTQVLVADAIRNRGSLKGVYGANNPIVAKASQKTRASARAAWLKSAQKDWTHGIRYFGCDADGRYFRSIGLHPAFKSGRITFWK